MCIIIGIVYVNDFFGGINMAWFVVGCVVLALVISIAAQINLFTHLKNGTIYR